MSNPSFSMWVTTFVELTKLKTIEFEDGSDDLRPEAAARPFNCGNGAGFVSSDSASGNFVVTAFSFTSRGSDSGPEGFGVSSALAAGLGSVLAGLSPALTGSGGFKSVPPFLSAMLSAACSRLLQVLPLAATGNRCQALSALESAGSGLLGSLFRPASKFSAAGVDFVNPFRP
jgi:hypothetical protein